MSCKFWKSQNSFYGLHGKELFLGTLVELSYLLGLEFVPPSSVEFVVSRIIENDTFNRLKKVTKWGLFISLNENKCEGKNHGKEKSNCL